MNKKRIEENLASIKFWGRISATTADYLIVCGIFPAAANLDKQEPQKKFFYATSKNLILQQLPELYEEFVSKSEALAGVRFTGNPQRRLGNQEEEDQEDEEEEQPQEEEEGKEVDGDEEKPPKKEKKPKFSEAHRLSYVVRRIDEDCFLVPSGAYVATATHHVVQNNLFTGLPATEAGHLSQYLHFRGPQHPARKNALAKAALLGDGQSFMDPASEDAPAGTWALRLDKAKAQVSVRSLRWPGYFFYHDVATPYYGSVYFGDGRENKDIQFNMPRPALYK